MLNKPISYKFIPVLAAMLCIFSAAQAVNFHIGFDIPLCRPAVRPVYLHPDWPGEIPEYVAPRVVRHCHSAIDNLMHEIQHALNNVYADLCCFSSAEDRDLARIFRTIKNNWGSWIIGLRSLQDICGNRSIQELEIISSALREIHHDLRRQRVSTASLSHFSVYSQVRSSVMNIADIIGSYRQCNPTDLHSIARHLGTIRHII